MNRIFTDTITVNADLEEVWKYFINLEENGPFWMNGISSLDKVSSGEVEEGTSYVFESRGKQLSTTITNYRPMDTVTLTSQQGKFRADYIYSFRKEDNGTKVTLNANCEASSLMKLLSPLIKVAIKKSDGDQLKKFKNAFETRTK